MQENSNRIVRIVGRLEAHRPEAPACEVRVNERMNELVAEVIFHAMRNIPFGANARSLIEEDRFREALEQTFSSAWIRTDRSPVYIADEIEVCAGGFMPAGLAALIRRRQALPNSSPTPSRPGSPDP